MTDRGTNRVDHAQWGQTEAEKFSFDYKWIINDFSYFFQESLTIKSPQFQIPRYPMTGIVELTKRRIQQVKRSYPEETLGDVIIDLKSELVPLVIRTEVSALKNSSGTKFSIAKKDTSHASETNRIYMSFAIESNEFVEGRLVKNDTMTIFCAITIISSVFTTANHQFQVPLPEYSLSNNFKSLLSNGKYSDMTITVGAKKFHVHKLILATRSSVFAAMFEHKLREDTTSNIDITDISGEVMEELLQFIYTDKTDKLEDMAIELLDAAEKYDLKNLKLLCAPRLQADLDFDNAAERLLIADRYNVEEVRDYILKFISANRKKVMQTDGYKAMQITHPNLLLEALQLLWDN